MSSPRVALTVVSLFLVVDEKKMELCIFRACEASDERKHAFGERRANRLNPF